MMILASAVLAGSLLATGAQARGGGGGGHMGGFAGGHIGGFGGAHVAGMGRDRFVGGRRGFYGYGADCPYCGSPYTWPYTCTY